METQTRKVKVKTLSDHVYDFEVNQHIKISDFKVLIAEKTNVPVDRQRLVFMAKLLDNQQPLSSYIKQDDKVVHLMARIEAQSNNNNNSQPQQNSNQQNNQQSNQSNQPNQPNQQNNPFAAMMGGFSGLSGILGFDPMSMISQITSQPGIINLGRPNSQSNTQPQSNTQLFGTSFVVPPPVNLPQTNNQNNQSQQNPPQSSNTQSSPQQNPHVHHHVPIALPFNNLQALGMSLNDMMGPGAMFPGPPLPPIENRNSVQVLGAYLSQWHFQISRLLPFIFRLGQLLQRQPLLTNPNDRILTQQLINRVPALFNQVSTATSSVIQHYSNLRLGNSPGIFSINQQQSQQQQQQQQSFQIGQPVVSVQVISSNSDPINLVHNNSNSSTNTQFSSSNQQPNQTNSQGNSNLAASLTGSLNSILPNLQGIIGSIIPGFSMGAPQPPQPQSPPAQSQPPQQQQSQNQNVQSSQSNQSELNRVSSAPQVQAPLIPNISSSQILSNPIGALSGLMSNNSVSSMLTTDNINMATNSNLRFMISEGRQISQEQQSIYSLIFGDISGGQLIQLFMSSNFSFLDNRRTDFKRGLQTALARYNNSRQALTEKIVQDILKIFVSEQLIASSEPGFDVNIVAQQILRKHILELIAILLDQKPEFSNRLVKQIKAMVGQLIFQLEEGSTKDVTFIITCIKASGSRVMDPYMMGMSAILFMVLDRGMQASYFDYKQLKEKNENMTEEDHKAQERLIQKIEKQGQEDKDQIEKFLNSKKSDYFK